MDKQSEVSDVPVEADMPQLEDISAVHQSKSQPKIPSVKSSPFSGQIVEHNYDSEENVPRPVSIRLQASGSTGFPQPFHRNTVESSASSGLSLFKQRLINARATRAIESEKRRLQEQEQQPTGPIFKEDGDLFAGMEAARSLTEMTEEEKKEGIAEIFSTLSDETLKKWMKFRQASSSSSSNASSSGVSVPEVAVSAGSTVGPSRRERFEEQRRKLLDLSHISTEEDLRKAVNTLLPETEKRKLMWTGMVDTNELFDDVDTSEHKGEINLEDEAIIGLPHGAITVGNNSTEINAGVTKQSGVVQHPKGYLSVAESSEITASTQSGTSVLFSLWEDAVNEARIMEKVVKAEGHQNKKDSKKNMMLEMRSTVNKDVSTAATISELNEDDSEEEGVILDHPEDEGQEDDEDDEEGLDLLENDEFGAAGLVQLLTTDNNSRRLAQFNESLGMPHPSEPKSRRRSEITSKQKEDNFMGSLGDPNSKVALPVHSSLLKLRFDLRGHLVDPSKRPSNEEENAEAQELMHHSNSVASNVEDSELVLGYTLVDLMGLTRSTEPHQRATSLRTLALVLQRRRASFSNTANVCTASPNSKSASSFSEPSGFRSHCPCSSRHSWWQYPASDFHYEASLFRSIILPPLLPVLLRTSLDDSDLRVVQQGLHALAAFLGHDSFDYFGDSKSQEEQEDSPDSDVGSDDHLLTVTPTVSPLQLFREGFLQPLRPQPPCADEDDYNAISNNRLCGSLVVADYLVDSATFSEDTSLEEEVYSKSADIKGNLSATPVEVESKGSKSVYDVPEVFVSRDKHRSPTARDSLIDGVACLADPAGILTDRMGIVNVLVRVIQSAANTLVVAPSDSASKALIIPAVVCLTAVVARNKSVAEFVSRKAILSFNVGYKGSAVRSNEGRESRSVRVGLLSWLAAFFIYPMGQTSSSAALGGAHVSGYSGVSSSLSATARMDALNAAALVLQLVRTCVSHSRSLAADLCDVEDDLATTPSREFDAEEDDDEAEFDRIVSMKQKSSETSGAEPSLKEQLQGNAVDAIPVTKDRFRRRDGRAAGLGPALPHSLTATRLAPPLLLDSFLQFCFAAVETVRGGTNDSDDADGAEVSEPASVAANRLSALALGLLHDCLRYGLASDRAALLMRDLVHLKPRVLHSISDELDDVLVMLRGQRPSNPLDALQGGFGRGLAVFDVSLLEQLPQRAQLLEILLRVQAAVVGAAVRDVAALGVLTRAPPAARMNDCARLCESAHSVLVGLQETVLEPLFSRFSALPGATGGACPVGVRFFVAPVFSAFEHYLSASQVAVSAALANNFSALAPLDVQLEEEKGVFPSILHVAAIPARAAVAAALVDKLLLQRFCPNFSLDSTVAVNPSTPSLSPSQYDIDDEMELEGNGRSQYAFALSSLVAAAAPIVSPSRRRALASLAVSRLSLALLRLSTPRYLSYPVQILAASFPNALEALKDRAKTAFASFIALHATAGLQIARGPAERPAIPNLLAASPEPTSLQWQSPSFSLAEAGLQVLCSLQPTQEGLAFHLLERYGSSLFYTNSDMETGAAASEWMALLPLWRDAILSSGNLIRGRRLLSHGLRALFVEAPGLVPLLPEAVEALDTASPLLGLQAHSSVPSAQATHSLPHSSSSTPLSQSILTSVHLLDTLRGPNLHFLPSVLSRRKPKQSLASNFNQSGDVDALEAATFLGEVLLRVPDPVSTPLGLPLSLGTLFCAPFSLTLVLTDALRPLLASQGQGQGQGQGQTPADAAWLAAVHALAGASVGAISGWTHLMTKLLNFLAGLEPFWTLGPALRQFPGAAGSVSPTSSLESLCKDLSFLRRIASFSETAHVRFIAMHAALLPPSLPTPLSQALVRTLEHASNLLGVKSIDSSIAPSLEGPPTIGALRLNLKVKDAPVQLLRLLLLVLDARAPGDPDTEAVRRALAILLFDGIPALPDMLVSDAKVHNSTAADIAVFIKNMSTLAAASRPEVWKIIANSVGRGWASLELSEGVVSEDSVVLDYFNSDSIESALEAICRVFHTFLINMDFNDADQALLQTLITSEKTKRRISSLLTEKSFVFDESKISYVQKAFTSLRHLMKSGIFTKGLGGTAFFRVLRLISNYLFIDVDKSLPMSFMRFEFLQNMMDLCGSDKINGLPKWSVLLAALILVN